MRTVAIISMCLLTVSAAAQSLTEKTAIDSLVGRAPSTQDFVTEAVISDMFEIQSSKLALIRWRQRNEPVWSPAKTSPYAAAHLSGGLLAPRCIGPGSFRVSL